MKVFHLPQLHWYRNYDLKIDFPESWDVNFYPMKGYYDSIIDVKEIKRALREPINSKSLRNLAEGKRDIAIVVDDMTRPTKVHQIIKYVLDELKEAKIPSDNIRFIVGLGTHGACYRFDMAKKLGERVVNEYAVYNHNPFYGNEKFGETSYGTPIEVNAEYASCDLKIAIGSILPHPGAGFGGGSKLILPGIAGFNSIYHLHGEVEGRKEGKGNPNTGWGKVKNNDMRKDMDEFTKIVGLDIKIDVLVNGKGDTTKIFAGNFVDEFEEGVKNGREHYSTENLPDKVDVIIANIYAKANEAILGLINWKHKLDQKGVMVLIANAPEGQITHYMVGTFGKRFGAPLKGEPITPFFNRLIVLSKYKILDPWLPIALPEKIMWIKNWKEVLEEIKNIHKNPRIAIIPNADIQCEEKILKAE
ncbi:MAG: lactate racemase domain-containing protein [Nitrososphaerales archaeon]